jgi:hypothetical protein
VPKVLGYRRNIDLHNVLMPIPRQFRVVYLLMVVIGTEDVDGLLDLIRFQILSTMSIILFGTSMANRPKIEL